MMARPEPHRPWDVCGTMEISPDLRALIETTPMIRVERTEPIRLVDVVDMARNDGLE